MDGRDDDGSGGTSAPDGTAPGGGTLRARKKWETRQRISGVATLLFLDRGFDQVTVAEVAAAADVSTMTVFNHFPRKEDLFFDRIPEAVELVVAAVRDREPGEPPLAALYRAFTRLAETRHALSALGARTPRFWQVVVDSAALRARAREGVEEIERALAGALAATSDDPAPDLTAALAVAAYRTVFVATARRMLSGATAEEAERAHHAALAAAFTALAEGVGAAARG
jgi:AcrR family transcriptional regulator